MTSRFAVYPHSAAAIEAVVVHSTLSKSLLSHFLLCFQLLPMSSANLSEELRGQIWQ